MRAKKRSFLFSFLFFICYLLFVSPALAGNLTNAKDTISTSRPSAASPLNGDHASGATLINIYDNKSIFLASDSAKIVKNTGVFQETNLNVASQSADRTKVYLTGSGLTGSRNGGVDVLIVPVTAKHTIQFTTSTGIPSGGDLVIAFSPGGTNQASPSATGFAFNNLQTSNISISGATCNTWSVNSSAGTISCTNLNAVDGSTTVTVTIGSSTPALINPTKSANIGTADTWAVTISTYDDSGIELDSTKVKIGTIESVLVRATVEPTLTFTITGLSNGTDIEASNNGCAGTLSQTTNSGIDASATVVDLGILSNGQKNYAGQEITISTNLSGGYVLTATSSGQLRNPATGYSIANAQGAVTNNDTPAPATMTAGTEAFGIHVCGTDVNSSTWGARTNIDTDVKYANPSPIYYYTLASRTSAANSIKTSVVYAGTVSATTPPGLYTTVLTYVATPIF